jgi:uncharacterized membrane protein (DUF2068 family)
MTTKNQEEPSKGGLRIVAGMEAMKGVLVLLAGCGLLTVIHKDLHLAAVHLVQALHFNPAKHYPSIFIDAADKVSDLQLWMLALSALLYSVIRFVEAYGLWNKMQWAEWFGLLSGAMYIPLEIFEASREFTWPRITVLLVNLGVVGYLGDALLKSRKSQKRLVK